ncbi:hypothetical protein V5N11_018912 [Cardamine amara subsp. amara]|uniref:TFIIS N-terminal domain-containing protein n=1 Tax=Cardamine amara subsp. amara TaxID=228776 RepID=A0ABD1BZE2_CARAN
MTIEDFFTLTEIKDGLTVISRVEELVSVIQSNKDPVLKNNGDACRQWTAVASTIAATKNRDCLDVFVNLDGLPYLSSWLAEAQMLANDSVDKSIEASIIALLEAIENLGVDSSKLVSSGIWVAVKKLVDHGNSRVQDQARKLVGSWKDKELYDHSERDTESCSKVHEAEMRVVAASRDSSGQKSALTLCSMQSNNEQHRPETADEALVSASSEENNPDQEKGLELQKDKAGFDSNVNSHCSNTMTETFNGSSTDDIMQEVQEKLSVKESSGPTMFNSMPTGSSCLLSSERDTAEGPSNAPLGAEVSKEKQMANYVHFLEKRGEAVAGTSSSAGHVAVSSDSIIASMELEKNNLLQSSLDSNEVSRNASETICGSHDVSVTHNSKQVPSLTHTTDNQDSDNSSRLSGGHGRNRKVESDNITAHADNEGKKDDKGYSDIKRRVKRRKKRSSSRSMTISQRLGAIDKTTTDIDLGILDALEVATKVAQEVAREVDSGEPSHSSPEELSDESEQSGSQDSRDDDRHTGSPSKGLSVGENHSFEEPHVGDDNLMEAENGMMNSDDIEESHLAAAAKSEVGREKSPCGFDLNQDICPDETDVTMSSISTTTTPMSVSHSVSSTGMPAAAPLQLERSLSGKGSAATSVFSPALLPHKVPSENLREKQVIFRGIDLNVAEVGDDQVDDQSPWKQFPFSSSNTRDGESSHEANLRGSNRFNLDLNCTNEDVDMPPPSESKMETRLFLSHNGQQSASPVSSSSVAQQSGKEVNFDLNDRPQFFIDSQDQGPYYGRHPWSTAPYGGQKVEEPVLSFLGTKVDVDRKDSVSQMASFLSNGKSLEPAGGSFMGRTGNSLGLASGVSFSPAPIYGYNGLPGPPGLPMSSPMYVPGTAIPYMVDSRGGSPSMNGSVRPNFDQSSGFGHEIGNRESLSLRQFLSPSQSGGMGEHSGANVEPSSSSSISIGKRKEREPRWEFPPWR